MKWSRKSDKDGRNHDKENASFESKAHYLLKEQQRQILADNHKIWSPSREECPEFLAQVVTEYVYPVSASPQGANYTRLRSPSDYANEPLTREQAIAANDPPRYIFDVAVESSRGLLYVIEVVKTNPVAPHKAAFLASIGVPLKVVFAPPWVPRKDYIEQRRWQEQNAERLKGTEAEWHNEWKRYLYDLRDLARKRYGLPALRPFLSFEESKDLWEWENGRG